MTSQNLMDVLNSISSPIQQAESAVREDDVEALRKLLAKPETGPNAPSAAAGESQTVTEDTMVNPQAHENLLHFAVHQIAAKCVALLASKPYCWNPDRPNLIGRTPAQLAESRGYLPVWYPLAAHSNEVNKSSAEQNSRSLAAFLIHPSRFLEKPFSWSDEIVSPNSPLPTGSSISLTNKFGDFDKDLSAANLALFFELLMATPGAVNLSSEDPTPTSISLRMNTDSHPPNCDSYPRCLIEAIQSLGELEPKECFQKLLDIWSLHRLSFRLLDGDDEREDSEVTKKKSNQPAISPLTLLATSRVIIRRLITAKLKDLKKSASPKDLAQSYPSLIARLPLPPRLHAFLAYRDLWPAWERHMVPHRYHPRRIPRARPPRPPMHPLIMFDPWFNEPMELD